MKEYKKLVRDPAGLFSGEVPAFGYVKLLKESYGCVQPGEYPALLSLVSDGILYAITKAGTLGLAQSNYCDTWVLYLPAGFTVETPDGTLNVYDKCEEEYPGVIVELDQKDTAEGVDVTLAMVEFIPGGEGIADHSNDTEEMQRQNAEVVPQRRAKDPVNGYEYVTRGLVTRSWPDEVHNQDRHLRTFHFGYDKPYEEDEQK